ncbi:VOC family protein [Serratia ureilytica]
MGIKRLNHAVLYVSDVRQSADFYHQVLGFKLAVRQPRSGGVYPGRRFGQRSRFGAVQQEPGQQRAGVFRANNEPPAEHEPAAGLYHLAWEVDSLEELERIRHQLAERGILGLEEDHGVHKSIYGHDPDGLLFEVTWFIPPALLTEEDKNQQGSARWISPPRNGASPAGKRLGYGRRGAPTITALC